MRQAVAVAWFESKCSLAHKGRWDGRHKSGGLGISASDRPWVSTGDNLVVGPSVTPLGLQSSKYSREWKLQNAEQKRGCKGRRGGPRDPGLDYWRGSTLTVQYSVRN